MANEIEWTYASSIALETSGGTVANAGFNSGDGASITSGGHGNWPLADFIFYNAGFGSALAGNQVINLYRECLDAVGDANFDEVAPSAAYKYLYVGSFQMQLSNATNSTGYHSLNDVPLSAACIFYIENVTGQQMNSGWGLYCRPKSYIPGA